MSTLYVVATPIGNLDDMTLRAIKTLKEADLIAAEDTRHTKKLLTHYGIHRPVVSYYEHNEKEKAVQLVERLKAGASIALVTDAGTPGISDPGYRLVKLAAENGVQVVAIPGPCAFVSALSIAGLPTDEFTFKGFVPATASHRRDFFTSMKGTASTFIVYESARRLKETLVCVYDVLGDIDIAVARELTKLHEEVLRGTVGKVREAVKDRELKGEITLVLRTRKAGISAAGIEEALTGLLQAGMRLNDAVKEVAKETGMSKSLVYKEALRIKGSMGL